MKYDKLEETTNNIPSNILTQTVKKNDKDPTWGGRMKKFGEVLAKSAVRLAPSQRDEGSDYILLLKSLFDDCQFLGMHFIQTFSYSFIDEQI